MNEELKQKLIIESLKVKTDTSSGRIKTFDQFKYAYKNNLAKNFYDFLRGDSDILPHFKKINAVIRKNDSDDFIISVGCGLFVIFDGSRLYVRYEEPLSKTTTKIEEIFSNKYDVEVFDGNFSNKKTKSSFKKSRIIVFQNYLKQYSNYIKENEIQDIKSKNK